MMFMNKLANFFLMVIIVIVLFILSWGTITVVQWKNDRESPVIFEKVTVLTPAVRPGDRVRVQLNINRVKNMCRVHIDRILFDGNGDRHAVDDEDYNANPGALGRDSFIEGAIVPHWFEKGTGRFRMIRSYYCNPIHTWFNEPVVVRIPDAEFQIVERRIP